MSKPQYINKVGGWAQDIVKMLWGDVPEDNSKFIDLNKRVLDEVHFPCVIFAQYDLGIVAIDCNDCDTYEVDDKRIKIYVKLQFNPKHKYKQKVYPFTFVPQNASFALNLDSYRSTYSNTIKMYPAWGRFIAVSIDRYNISHQMGRLGLPGGAYVVSKDGYNDHYLDPIKPRERMSFEEYASHMFKSMAVIDARGFGDLTHRTIESLAIGIPLIRPKFTNVTWDPLIPGVHYLDCGSRGENLQECVEAVQNSHLRNSLIQNGLHWYKKNCAPAGLQYMLSNIIGQYFTPPKQPIRTTVPNPKPIANPKFHMLIGLYKDKSDNRMREIVETFTFNIANDMIEKIHVFWEDPTSLEEAVKIIPELKHPKVDLIWHGRRLFFYDLFRYANANLQRVIIANNDIYFGNLDKLANYDLTGRILNLSRWDVFKWGVPKYMDCDASQDAWIFQTPVPLDPQFHLGWWGCDGRINKESVEAGLKVSNPSYEIFVYHNHPSGVRNYDSTIHNVPDGMGIPPSNLIWSRDVVPNHIEPLAELEFHDDEGYRTQPLIEEISSHRNQHRPFTFIPSELYGLQFIQVLSWKSSPMRIKCLKPGTVYFLIGHDWSGGVENTLQGHGAKITNLAMPETTITKYTVWSLDMKADQEIIFPAQIMAAGKSLVRV